MMRPFTQLEEQALLRMLGQPGASWRPIPPAPGKCPYNRLAALGCAQVMSQGPIRSARLTVAGRYFAGLLASVCGAKLERQPEEKTAGDQRPPNERKFNASRIQHRSGRHREHEIGEQRA
jgi:hypothetical protein